MSVFHNNILAGASGAGGAAGFKIERSLRFNSGDSAYLNRTPSSAGNRKTWTWSGWVKRSDSYPNLFTVDGSTAANFFQFVFETNDQLYVRTANNTNNLITTAKFRDFSAWYHVVLAVDTTQATASNRLKLYVNGSQVTQFDTESYPAQNAELNVNTTNAHYIGRAKYDSFSFVYSDGYLAEVHFVNGEALAPTDFGEFDENTGAWNPIEFAKAEQENYETSTITNVSDVNEWASQTFSDNVTVSTQINSSINNIANLFDSNTSNAASTNSNGSNLDVTWTLTLEEPVLASNVKITGSSFGPASIGFQANFRQINSDGNEVGVGHPLIGYNITPSASGTTFNFSGAPVLLKKISCYCEKGRSDTGINYTGVFIDGVRLQDDTAGPVNGKKLTVTDNTDLSKFAVGLAVNGTSNTVKEVSTTSPFSITVTDGNYRGSDNSGAVGGATTVTATRYGYGTNGFYLDFSDNSSNSALGTDSSGNSNTWTVNNLSVASGAGNDSLIDTPTNYTASSGNNGGNYATLNPLDFASSGSPTLTNGNLDAAADGGWQTVAATIGKLTSGKWYWEVKLGGAGGHRTGLSSVSRSDASEDDLLGSGDIAVNSSDGRVYVDGSTVGTGVGSLSGKTVGIALNLDANSVSFYQNNSLIHTVSSLSSTASWTPVHAVRYGSPVDNLNFGQRPFAYTPPTGHVSICTTNLPDPTVADGSDYFDVKTYSGTGSSQSISGLSFSPDFIWIKNRSVNDTHAILDTARGTNTVLSSNLTNGDRTEGGSLTAFNSDGFTVGSYNDTNRSGSEFVAWTWDAGTSAASNTDGSITSTVRANPTAGFSIVTYNGNGSNSQTVGHGLNAVPEWVIYKRRAAGDNWKVYHHTQTATKLADLNTTGAFTTNNDIGTAPTSSVISVSSSNSTYLNDSTNNTYIAYCFAPVAGHSAFGSYVGNGSADGPFIYTGFRVRWLLRKQANSAQHWHIVDTERDPENVTDSWLFPNLSDVEGSGDSDRNTDLLSNGFKIRSAYTYHNQNGSTYIYAAFAEHPFKTARAR